MALLKDGVRAPVLERHSGETEGTEDSGEAGTKPQIGNKAVNKVVRVRTRQHEKARMSGGSNPPFRTNAEFFDILVQK